MIDRYSIRHATMCALLAAAVTAFAPSLALGAVPNVAVCTAPYNQMPPTAVPNGAGGALITWADLRSGDVDIYLQQTNTLGQPQWTIDGIAICKVAGFQQFPRVVADGTGGAIVVWQDQRGADLDIYAQRVSSSGALVWAIGGIPVSTATGAQELPQVVADGAGGAVIVWVDQRLGNQDVFAQRVDAGGNVLWTPDGVPLSLASGAQSDLSVVTDGWGGAIVAWKDQRGGAGSSDIYAQRVNSTGVPQWTVDGAVVSVAADVQESPILTADGAWGVVAAWADHRSGTWDVYAQRLNASGAAQWTANGVALCAAVGDQTAPKLCADGSGGAIVAWKDQRGANSDIYAQRVNGAGAAVWAADGAEVCTAAADQTAPSIYADGAGGAVITWGDLRTGANGSDVYAQRVNGASGAAAWLANGVVLCDTLGDQDVPVVVSDGEGGALAAWRDYRAGGGVSDVFAQHVDAGGLVEGQCPDTAVNLTNNVVTTAASSVNYYNVPVPIIVGWSAVGVRGAAGTDWDLEFYPQLAYGTGPFPVCFSDPMAGSAGSQGVDFVAVSHETGRTPANTVYGARASRFSGSGNGSVEFEILNPQGISKDGPGVSASNWTGVLNVYDVRLFAGQPYTFDFTRTGTGDLKVLLFTTNGLMGSYAAGRSGAVFETQSRYTTYTAPVTEWYGVVVVNDNGLSGGYTLRVLNGTPVGVGDGPVATPGLMSVAPNPSRGHASFRFALSQPGEVSFRVLDMAGRVVASIPTQRWQAGTWTVPWNASGSDGRALAAGVYFVQMELDGRRLGQQRLALVR